MTCADLVFTLLYYIWWPMATAVRFWSIASLGNEIWSTLQFTLAHLSSLMWPLPLLYSDTSGYGNYSKRRTVKKCRKNGDMDLLQHRKTNESKAGEITFIKIKGVCHIICNIRKCSWVCLWSTDAEMKHIHSLDCNTIHSDLLRHELTFEAMLEQHMSTKIRHRTVNWIALYDWPRWINK